MKQQLMFLSFAVCALCCAETVKIDFASTQNKSKYGNKVEISPEAVAKFTPKGNLGTVMTLPNSEKKFRADKVGDQLTISLRFKCDALGKQQGLVSTLPKQEKGGWLFAVGEDGTLRFTTGGGFGNRSSKEKIVPGKWQQLAVSWEVGNKEGLKFYIDGVDAGINLRYVGDQPCTASNEAIRIGSRTADGYFPAAGELADVKLADEVIPADGIAAFAK